MEEYRTHQRVLLAEPNPPRTKERAYRVAKFVWDEQRIEGTRPSWKELCERWNEFTGTKPFERAAGFQANYRRGAKATPPRYFMTEEQMREAVKTRAHEGAFNKWVSSFRE